jgi:hypothetical protein
MNKTKLRNKFVFAVNEHEDHRRIQRTNLESSLYGLQKITLVTSGASLSDTTLVCMLKIHGLLKRLQFQRMAEGICNRV